MSLRNFFTAAVLVRALAVLAFAPESAHAADLYVLTGAGNGESNTSTSFGKIDIATGNYTQIVSNLSGSNLVANLAWNANASNFYVTENIDNNTKLRTLSTAGTLSTQIGSNIGRIIYGMAYRPDNTTLYGYDYYQDSTGTISPTAGGFTSLASGFGFSAAAPVGGRYTLLNNTIYMTVNDSFASGKFGTMSFGGSFTYIGSGNTAFFGMALASDGTSLYGVFANGTNGAQALYSIDPATGVPTFLRSVSGGGLGTRFYGAAIVPVPEPSTYALGGIATGVMAFLARRRKARRA